MDSIVNDARIIDEQGRPVYLIGGVVDAILDGIDPKVLLEEESADTVFDPYRVDLAVVDNDELQELLEEYILSFDEFTKKKYRERLSKELEYLANPYIRAVIASALVVMEQIEKKYPHVIIGSGRGSGCASLVLFLYGVHFVDPVLFDIPLSEFYKDETILNTGST